MISEEQKINIDTINLSELRFIDKKILTKQDFQYGNINGVAQMIGFQIILFKRNESEKNKAFSVDWGENENPIILDITQKILWQLKTKIFLLDKFSDIEAVYGKADYTNDIYNNSKTYYYTNEKEDIMYSFGISNSRGLIRFELIHDKEIVKQRIDCLYE